MKIKELLELKQDTVNKIGIAADLGRLATATPAGLATDLIKDIGMTILRGEPPELQAIKQRAQAAAAQSGQSVFFKMDVKAPGVFRLVKGFVGRLTGDSDTYFIVHPNGTIQPVSSGRTRGLVQVT